ncbi:hypothetical protein [Kribbella sp. NPDC051770]|uniref:hypothetical protein n=1 Tax=Kribbella sp. NPDC051770 TaxID=3155413 RepID=UPI0034318D18
MNKFDHLFATAAPLITAGRHSVDIPPTENHPRWPVSAVLRPDPADPVALRLDALTLEAAAVAGPGHYQTGQSGSAHLTVRALERHHEVVHPDEPRIQRYTEALRAAATETPPLTFTVTGLTLTQGTVMACATASSPHPDHFQKLYADALGPDAWLEGDTQRDIWYLNLLHFAAPIPSPTALINWVEAHRDHPLGQFTVDTTELVRFRHTSGARPHIRPETLATVALIHD